MVFFFKPTENNVLYACQYEGKYGKWKIKKYRVFHDLCTLLQEVIS